MIRYGGVKTEVTTNGVASTAGTNLTSGFAINPGISSATSLTGKIVKTFNHGRGTFAFLDVLTGKPYLLVRKLKNRDEWTMCSGADRSAQAAWDYAAKRWPEYI